MNGKLFLVSIAACLLLAGCVQTPPAATPSPTQQAPAVPTVTINNGFFAPATVAIAKGGSVTWFNNDIEQHTLYFFTEAGTILSPGENLNKTFYYAGNQTYAVIDALPDGSENRFEGLVVVT